MSAVSGFGSGIIVQQLYSMWEYRQDYRYIFYSSLWTPWQINDQSLRSNS